MLWNQNISLFSPQSIGQRCNRELLLQFFLFEILEAYKAYQNGSHWELILSSHPHFFPYDWATRPGLLNKAYEHSLFFTQCFPEHIQCVKNFEKKFIKILTSWEKKTSVPRKQFESSLQTIYSLLEPLIEVCRENENLLFFLLKNHQTIDSLMKKGHLCQFLHRIHPSELESLGEKICDRYHTRGFFSQIPEFKLLLTALTHA